MKKLFSIISGAMMSLGVMAIEPVTVQVYGDSLPEVKLYVYPAANPTGTAIVACPGGGYAMKAMGHEGHQFGPWLNDNGITLAVLDYRLPEGVHEIPSADAMAAMRLMRSHADEWGAQRVGIMGFSAGGHLASTVATHATGAARPDFQILFYPVITMNPKYTHLGSHNYLLGTNPPASLEAFYSGELQVNANTPRCLILSSWNDTTVPIENTINYSRALSAAGVAASVYIFPEGNHGWGFNDSFKFKPVWQQLFIDWVLNY